MKVLNNPSIDKLMMQFDYLSNIIHIEKQEDLSKLKDCLII